MKTINVLILGLSIIALALISCEKETTNDSHIQTGTIRLTIDNGFDGDLLSTDQEYIIESGDTVKISMMRYYISNVCLTKDNGDTVKIPNSYYLIDLEGRALEIKDIPTATYTGLCFGLGVDKDANHDIARNDGDLDPNGADGMIWDWNSGYKFIRIEGDYKGDTSSGSFKFHVGGDVNYKTMHFSENRFAMRISSSEMLFNAVVSSEKTTEIHLLSNLAEAFKTPNTIDLDTDNTAHGISTKIADNYAENFFQLQHVTVQ